MQKRKIQSTQWRWTCAGRDDGHGCWDADFDGYCIAKSRRAFKTEQEAKEAGLKHQYGSCHFGGPIQAWKAHE